jgi:CDP-paratose 2-epimerase
LKTAPVTASSGLIGSEVVAALAAAGWSVHGLDSNQRAVFFGPQGDTRWNQRRLEKEVARDRDPDPSDRPRG